MGSYGVIGQPKSSTMSLARLSQGSERITARRRAVLLGPDANYYIRSYPVGANAYGELKKRLTRQYPNDIDAYIDGKADFILGVLA